ncbi:hypothetical protein GGU10DRAFT_385580 [Lentinula aff. detonsa]|uniref:Uncharacterized protein n=1 Tax=Lentinula aff. detonsa TaxID=2804958 RepID=A0AA38KTY4_9AGAR|nr:hypothetical protein GGU10DRAFT_385580 [Lentinula aff. detonsa]
MWLLSPPKLYFSLFAGVLFFALAVVAVPVQPELPLMSGGVSSEDIENALSKTPSGTSSTFPDSPDLHIVDKTPGIEATLLISPNLRYAGVFKSAAQTILDPIVPKIVAAIESKYSTRLVFEEIQSNVPITTVVKDQTIKGLNDFQIDVSFSAEDKQGKLSHFSKELSYTGEIDWNKCRTTGGLNKQLLTGELRQGGKVLVTSKKGEVSLIEPTAKKSISQRLKSTFGKKTKDKGPSS